MMKVCLFFHSRLVKFLPLKKRLERIDVRFPGKRSVKDLVQSYRIPHTEIGGIRVNGQWVDLDHQTGNGDFIHVFPFCKEVQTGENPVYLTWSEQYKNYCKYTNQTKNNHHYEASTAIIEVGFVCDVHLWKLARRLRLLGIDVRHNPSWDDAQLADISQREKLILLTRDRGLLMRNKVEAGFYVWNTDPEEQVLEVLDRLGSPVVFSPFSRCLMCNNFLEVVDKDDPGFTETYAPLIPNDVLKWAREFKYCPTCRKMYWRGTHHQKLTRFIQRYRGTNQ